MRKCLRLLVGAALVLATAQAALGQSLAPLPRTIASEAEGDALENTARTSGDALIPTCRFEGARCGYIDRDGTTVIAPQFDWVDRFVDDRALVGRARKFGAIDATGGFAIAPSYDSMSRFDRGLALMLVGNRLGVVDHDGEVVVPAEHGLIFPIAEGTFLVAEPPYADAGRQPRPFREISSFPYAHAKRWGIVTTGGTWVVRPTFARVSAFSDDLNGLFWAADSAGQAARWQLMGPNGAPVSQELFDHTQRVQPGQDRAIVRRDGRWGAVNGRGEIVVDLKFDWLGYFRDGWAPYRLAGREGRIDQNGNIASAAAATPVMSAVNGKLGATVDGKPLYIDQSAAKLLGTDHPKCPDGRHLRFEQGRWTIVAADEKPAPDIAFSYVGLMCSGPSIVEHDRKWGFISSDGKLLGDRYFDKAQAFHDGIATVGFDGLWAVIGEDGSTLLGPLKLARSVGVTGKGEFRIEFENGYKRLDKVLIAELARNPDLLTRPLAPRLRWSEGLAAQFDDQTGKWGFVDIGRNVSIAPRFDAAGDFKNGVAWAAFPDRREWCQIDTTGSIKPGGRCQCSQPLVIVEHFVGGPRGADCYADGLRIVRESMMRATAR